MTNRCLTLRPNSRTRLKPDYRQIPVHVDHFRKYLWAILRVGDFADFNRRADQLLAVIGSAGLRFMRDTGIGFKFIVWRRRWGRTELYTDSGELLCRTSSFEEIRNFLHFHAYDDAAKRTRLMSYIDDLSMNYHNVFDAKKAGVLAGREIPLSARGLAPDYSTLTDILYAGNPANGRIRIKMTGVLEKDFKLANAVAELDKTPSTHVWHHLDDWDPVTGECTLQLVEKYFHAKVSTGTTHTGGVALWRYFYQIRNYL